MFIDAHEWDCPSDVYHADRKHLSHSLVEKFLESPELFSGIIRGQHVEEETPALRLGRLLHSEMEGKRLVFEPEHFSDVKDEWKRYDPAIVLTYPDFCFKGGVEKNGLMPNTNKARQQWEAENEGAVFMRPKDFSLLEDYWDWHRSLGNAVVCKDEAEHAKIKTMAKSIREHPQIAQIMGYTESVHEFTLTAVHEETGLPCRARLDFMTRGPHGVWILDWKSAASIADRQFSTSAYEHGYHRQAAWYMDIAAAFLAPEIEPEDISFVFVAVQKEYPWRCRPFTLGAIELANNPEIREWVDLGRRQNDAVLRAIAEGRAKGEYKTKGWDLISDLPAPRFAKFDDSFPYPLTPE